MKHIYGAVLVVLLAVALAACGDNNQQNANGSGGSVTVISSNATAMTNNTQSSNTVAGGNATGAVGTQNAGGSTATAAAQTLVSPTPGIAQTPSGTQVATSAGTPDPDLPPYPAATEVALPDTVAAIIGQYAGAASTQTISYVGYKTTDAPDKIKSFYTDALTKAGWTDNSAKVSSAMATAVATAGGAGAAGTALATAAASTPAAPGGSLAQMGITTAIFTKGSKQVAIIALPGQLAGFLNLPDVSPTDTLYITLSGQTR